VLIVQNGGGRGPRADMMVVVVPDAATVPAVADALRHIAITGVFYCPSYLREPWGGTVPPMPGCVWFHAVTSGRGELVVGDDRLELQSGDLALVPHGTGHRIEAGGPSEYPMIPDLPHEELSDNYAVLRYGKDGPLTELICGGLRLEHPSARRLLDGLPPVVHVRTARRTALGATLDLLADEVQRREVGSEAVISRLCDILVIQAIRHWMTSDEATSSPWLRAMGDPQLGPALAALHAEPAAPWTVSTLASYAAMSRSAFAARFRDVLGQPVMGYLTELRLQLAVDLLHRGDRTVAEIATAVGYESDASFSRVFKRHLGNSPRQARQAG
jgi:AraC-like DNA-binding protein